MAKTIEQRVEEFRNHPCLVHANNALILQNVRYGDDGSTSPCAEENIVDYFRKVLLEVCQECKE